MIRIRACTGYDIDRFIDIKPSFHKKPDQFGNDHCRMSVVDLDDSIIRQIIQCTSFLHTFIQDHLCGAAYHEILLINAQKPSFFICCHQDIKTTSDFLRYLLYQNEFRLPRFPHQQNRCQKGAVCLSDHDIPSLRYRTFLH